MVVLKKHQMVLTRYEKKISLLPKHAKEKIFSRVLFLCNNQKDLIFVDVGNLLSQIYVNASVIYKSIQKYSLDDITSNIHFAWVEGERF